ncbi:helix-turn-helix domain-containing protein [Tardiphaga robiniae]|uniref:winged helix-turn-helix transcriptional regulator n=1 Tax=Tardiphaga robiniae TaxID=943830 RepID=UPI0030B8D992
MRDNFEHQEDLQGAQGCPIRDVLNRIGDQWTLLVLGALSKKTLRFNELKREIGDVSQHMLARTLKRLEEDGLVSRTLFPVIPPRVDYALTPLGQSLLQPLDILIAWANAHHRVILDARRNYGRGHVEGA